MHSCATVTTLSTVEPGSKGHNLVLKVVSSNVVVEKTRTDSSRVKIAEALVGDNTGVIVLTARNSTLSLPHTRVHCRQRTGAAQQRSSKRLPLDTLHAVMRLCALVL
jgi:hypothetical protein